MTKRFNPIGTALVLVWLAAACGTPSAQAGDSQPPRLGEPKRHAGAERRPATTRKPGRPLRDPAKKAPPAAGKAAQPAVWESDWPEPDTPPKSAPAPPERRTT